MMQPHLENGCEYCDSTGIIETDNNGPIGNCPICNVVQINNRHKLKLLMANKSLTHREVANYIGVETRTVTSWLRNPLTNRSARNMQDGSLEKLIERTKHLESITS